MAETQTGKLPKLGERLETAVVEQSDNPGSVLSCQWCSVDLAPGETVCPTCGSPGVDGTMVVPDAPAVKPRPTSEAPSASGEELEEWWNDDVDNEYRNSAADEKDMMPVILGLIGTGIVCVILGVLVAPSVLASAFENSLGIKVENANDLRPLGGILGLITGAFIGAMGMWVTAPRR